MGCRFQACCVLHICASVSRPCFYDLPPAGFDVAVNLSNDGVGVGASYHHGLVAESQAGPIVLG